MSAHTSELKVTVRPGRIITVKLQIDAIRGDFHAQQGCEKTASFQCFLVFVPSLSWKNDCSHVKTETISRFSHQMERMLYVGPLALPICFRAVRVVR
eukprot:COSAG06_NODE_21540_length_753_cov_2.571865_1_plen_96_part_10